jgi:hypothetical protein
LQELLELFGGRVLDAIKVPWSASLQALDVLATKHALFLDSGDESGRFSLREQAPRPRR